MNSIRDVIYYPSCLFKQSRCSFNGNNADTDTNPETGKVGVRIHNKLTALILSCFGKISTGWDDDLQQRVYFNKASLENWRDWKNLSSSSELNIEEILLDVKSKNKEKVSQEEPEESHGTSSSHKSYLSEEDQETAALEEQTEEGPASAIEEETEENPKGSLEAEKENSNLNESSEKRNPVPSPVEESTEDSAAEEVEESSKVGSSEEVSDERREAAQKFVQIWIKEHGENFVGHGIFDAGNIEHVLDCGQLIPAEQMLREMGEVEYEAGMYGDRDRLKLPQLTEEEIHIFRRIEAKFEEGKPFGISLNLNRDEEEDDINLMVRVYYDPKVMFGEIFVCKKYFKKLDILAKKYGTTRAAVAAAYDQSKPKEERIDSFLYKFCQELPEEFKNELQRNEKLHVRFNTMLIEARQHVIPPSKLNHEIRVAHNIVPWGYGEVVILRGNPDAVVHKSELKSQRRGEQLLLEPWENEGYFFSLDLDDPDTFVLGPRKILEPFQESAEEKGILLVYTEDLSKEQRKFFNL